MPHRPHGGAGAGSDASLEKNLRNNRKYVHGRKGGGGRLLRRIVPMIMRPCITRWSLPPVRTSCDAVPLQFPSDSGLIDPERRRHSRLVPYRSRPSRRREFHALQAFSMSPGRAIAPRRPASRTGATRPREIPTSIDSVSVITTRRSQRLMSSRTLPRYGYASSASEAAPRASSDPVLRRERIDVVPQ
jgi:hypothetical protein